MSRYVPTPGELSHVQAMILPTAQERPIVQLVQLCEQLALSFGRDRVLREGVAQLVLGTQRLLNASWGARLNRGTLDGTLCDVAERIGFNIDTHEWKDAS